MKANNRPIIWPFTNQQGIQALSSWKCDVPVGFWCDPRRAPRQMFTGTIQNNERWPELADLIVWPPRTIFSANSFTFFKKTTGDPKKMCIYDDIVWATFYFCFSILGIILFSSTFLSYLFLIRLLSKNDNNLTLKGQYRHNQSRLSTGHRIGVLV